MKQFLRKAFIALMVLNVLDLSLTYYAFHIDGVYEKSPINAILLSLGLFGYLLGFLKDFIILYVILYLLPKVVIKDDEKLRDNCILMMTIILFVIKVIMIVNNIYLIGFILSGQV